MVTGPPDKTSLPLGRLPDVVARKIVSGLDRQSFGSVCLASTATAALFLPHPHSIHATLNIYCKAYARRSVATGAPLFWMYISLTFGDETCYETVPLDQWFAIRNTHFPDMTARRLARLTTRYGGAMKNVEVEFSYDWDVLTSEEQWGMDDYADLFPPFLLAYLATLPKMHSLLIDGWYFEKEEDPYSSCGPLTHVRNLELRYGSGSIDLQGYELLLSRCAALESLTITDVCLDDELVYLAELFERLGMRPRVSLLLRRLSLSAAVDSFARHCASLDLEINMWMIQKKMYYGGAVDSADMKADEEMERLHGITNLGRVRFRFYRFDMLQDALGFESPISFALHFVKGFRASRTLVCSEASLRLDESPEMGIQRKTIVQMIAQITDSQWEEEEEEDTDSDDDDDEMEEEEEEGEEDEEEEEEEMEE